MMWTKVCHWVGPYLRVRFGRVESVSGYWRCCG
jgi:hypothetical protein